MRRLREWVRREPVWAGVCLTVQPPPTPRESAERETEPATSVPKALVGRWSGGGKQRADDDFTHQVDVTLTAGAEFTLSFGGGARLRRIAGAAHSHSLLRGMRRIAHGGDVRDTPESRRSTS
ncbi:hypothetical protein GCM10022419_097400 [Nonomuraea rosea]|uniref:Uncharacterized protein n=1 Tax=Nonomuraea rosea TaxID=638574 RepID=A0ABP6Z7D4_9ACTN